MADGKIVIETDLDSSEVEKDLSDLKKDVKVSAEKIAQEVDKSAKKVSEDISKNVKKTFDETEKHYKKSEEQSKQSAENVGKHWTGAVGRLKKVTSIAAKASAVALGTGVVASVKAGISFESAFTGVKKTVNATDKELKTLKADIRGMAKEMPESVEEIAGVAEAAGQLGIKTKSIKGFTRTMVQLGDSTNLSSESAATSLARFANITGMSQKNFDRLGSTVVALGNNLATTEAEIVDMAMRIAGAGAQVGMTESQILSFSGALSSVGIEAEAGGTAFSTLLSKMNLATTKGGEGLKNFAEVAGMSSGEFKKAFEQDASRAVIAFIQGLDRINQSGGSAIKILDDMGLSDVRMRDALLRAAGASDQFTKAVELGSDAWDKNTALTKEAETRYGTMESQLKITKNKLKDMGISVYEDLSKPMAKGLASANKHLDKFLGKIDKGGIKSVIPEEAVHTVENLGSVAKAAGGGGLKILSKSLGLLADNLDVVVPLTTAYFGAMAGYKVFGLASTALNTLAGAQGVLNAMQTAGTLTATAQTGGLTALQTVVGLFTGKISLATAATGAFNTACTALGGPVGLAVVAVGALAAGVAAYTLTQEKQVSGEQKLMQSIEKSAEKQKEYLKEVKENQKGRQEAIATAQVEGKQADMLADKLNGLMSVENKSAGQKAQIKSIVEELNSILPDLGLAYDEEKDKLNQSTEAIAKNIEAQKRLAMAKAYGAQVESVSKDVIKTEEKLADATQRRNKAEENLNAAKEKWGKQAAQGNKIAAGEINDSTAAYKSADEQVKKYQKTLNSLNAELDTMSSRQIGETNYAEFLGDIDRLKEEAKLKSQEIPASVSEGIREGAYSNPATGDELNSLIKIDGLIQKAKAEGVKVPIAVSQGMQSGKYAIPSGVDEMKALINFDSLQSKSLKSGAKIPQNLTQGIASGKTKPSEAVKQMEALIRFDKMITESGKAGDKAVKELVSSVNSGKMKPVEAVKQMSALMGNKAKSEMGKAGKDGGNEFAKGVDSAKGEAQKSAKNVVESAKTGAESETSGFTGIGNNISSGIAAGIRGGVKSIASAAADAVRKAKAAAKAEADIHSPSKVFEKEVGKFLPLGMASGIRKNTKEVEEASREMAEASFKATADELEIHSPSKKYKRAIGVNIPRGIASGVKAARIELVGEMKSTMAAALTTAKSSAKAGKYSLVGSELISGLSKAINVSKTRSSNKLQESLNTQYESVVTANEKAENKIQSKIEKTKSKKTKTKLKKRLAKLKKSNAKEEKLLKEAGEKVANAFNIAFDREAERLTGLAQKKVQELSEAYQKEYDSITAMRDSLASKQKSWGNVYDLEQNIRDISRYQSNLKALEKKIPESLMERILGMNVDEATAYMDWFRSMTTAQQNAYIANWNKQQSMADSFSKSFFEDDLKKLEKEYQIKLKSATDHLKKQMNKAGGNIARGLAAGIKSETRTVTSAVKSLCNKLVKKAKKTLGIHSPSKVFEGIGEQDIRGLKRGHENKEKDLYRQMDRLSMTMAQRFAEAPLDLPRIREKMESAVLKQMGRITASVKLPEIKVQRPEREVSQKTVYTGPEKIEVISVLDGREVARTTVPFMDQFLNEIVTRKLRGGA